MITKAKYIVACNGIEVADEKTSHYLELRHGRDKKSECNIRIDLTNFVSSIYTLDDKKKDLLEIAGHVFAADRKTYRGSKETLEMHSWSREFEIHIKVRDLEFWNRPKVKELLNESLSFMTGDHNFGFVFYQAEDDYPTNIFDDKKFALEPNDKLKVVLFSGGLDSLSGVIKLLEETDDDLCLVSHLSGNPSVENTQTNLYEEINELYPGRCFHYKFHCGLSRQQSVDETQRTRSFLFNSIAFALASTYGKNENILFENGITSFNFSETQDMINSRSSRTTHPKTLGLLSELFSEINGSNYNIENRYHYNTKTDVVNVLKQYNKTNLIETSVSCSKTRTHRAHSTHCGVCSQCIDRRFATYSASLEDFDRASLYDFDFIVEDLEIAETIKALNDYLRMAKNFYEKSLDGFHDYFLDELIDIEEYLDGESSGQIIKNIYDVCYRHGEQIDFAIKRMIMQFDKPLLPIRPKSFFKMILGLRENKLDKPIEAGIEDVIEESDSYLNGNGKLKNFERGELKKELEIIAVELNLEMDETVPSTKINSITRKLIKKGLNAKATSISSKLRSMGYVKEGRM